MDSLETGRAVTVRVNDRGPFVPGRVIDVSRSAARTLGLVGPGTARVRLTAVGQATSGECRAETSGEPAR